MTTVTHEGSNTRIGLDWAAIRQQLIAAGVPVLRLLPTVVPRMSTGRAVCAMWCAQRVWTSRPQPTVDEVAASALWASLPPKLREALSVNGWVPTGCAGYSPRPGVNVGNGFMAKMQAAADVLSSGGRKWTPKGAS